eukprot:TRINITY_DN1452_c0_g1_i15.p1 TRINITY_DN1452_c0_g1~~TRINITY_DN1452_c0_g1_i15.p1  ORF type:complete len:122 (-),score=30.57 TRINITY_DN1452_c0_g1_i15:42-407(-)
MLSYNVKIIDVLHNQDEKFKYENPIHFWTALLKNSKYSAGYLYNALETRPGLQSILYERLLRWIVKEKDNSVLDYATLGHLYASLKSVATKLGKPDEEIRNYHQQSHDCVKKSLGFHPAKI